MARVGIVGAGMLGMTAALRLAQRGHSVTIFEASGTCGGLAAAWQLGDITWDRHYHVTLFSDTALRGLLRELDLEKELQWVTTRTGFFAGGRMYSMSHIADFMRFPPLSPLQKARLTATIMLASRIRNWKPLEQITAVDWLTRYSGRDTVEKLWLPLLRAKLGPYAQEASAAFIWTVIARMYRARRTGAKRELFGYVPGGYDRILQRFEQHLRGQGIRIELSCPITSIQRRPEGLDVTAASGTQTFDAVVVTLAAPLAARLCPQLTADEQTLCRNVPYLGIVCASVVSDTSLTPYYITNITDHWVPFTAVIEMTSLVNKAQFGGRSLIYLPKYASPSDAIFSSTDAEIEETFLGALERMHSHFSRKSVRAFRISRVPHVMPVPTLHYSHRLPPSRTSVPGLHLVNSAHIVNGTLNVNETVMLADNALGTVLEDLSERKTPQIEMAV